jgi:hypothetical protein
VRVDNEAFLQEQQDQINELLRPYQREVNRQQRIADFVTKCIRSASRDDFFQLYELLNSKLATEAEDEVGDKALKAVFDALRQDVDQKVERYQFHFLEDFGKLVEDAGLPLENNFPRLRFLKGIELEMVFAEKSCVLNDKPLKTVDPARILRAVLALKRRLYDRPFEPQEFIDGLYAAYHKVNQADGRETGESAPILPVYMEYTLSLQPRSFFQDMTKGRFREYDADQFSVDFWRYFSSSDVSSTSDGHTLRLTPGPNNALWLIDASGEKRRITSLSFQKD